jgi:hypothetical protein
MAHFCRQARCAGPSHTRDGKDSTHQHGDPTTARSKYPPEQSSDTREAMRHYPKASPLRGPGAQRPGSQRPALAQTATAPTRHRRHRRTDPSRNLLAPRSDGPLPQAGPLRGPRPHPGREGQHAPTRRPHNCPIKTPPEQFSDIPCSDAPLPQSQPAPQAGRAAPGPGQKRRPTRRRRCARSTEVGSTRPHQAAAVNYRPGPRSGPGRSPEATRPRLRDRIHGTTVHRAIHSGQGRPEVVRRLVV